MRSKIQKKGGTMKGTVVQDMKFLSDRLGDFNAKLEFHIDVDVLNEEIELIDYEVIDKDLTQDQEDYIDYYLKFVIDPEEALWLGKVKWEK